MEDSRLAVDRIRPRTTALRPDGRIQRSQRETLIFPRYHQLDAVRRLAAATLAAGVGGHYLIQHSAGSGKSNSIAWLAHRLYELQHALDASGIYHAEESKPSPKSFTKRWIAKGQLVSDQPSFSRRGDDSVRRSSPPL